MKAVINPELSQYIHADIHTKRAVEAKAFLDKVGLPAQYREAQKAKEKAVVLCNELKAERLRQHLSQTALANKIGMQKEFVSRIENGRVDVQLSTFLKIVEGLGLKVAVK